MSKILKVILYTAYVGFGLLIPAGVILLFALHTTAYKHYLERTLSASLSMDVEITGRLETSFIGGLQVAANEIHIRKQEAEIASAGTVSLAVDVLPLLVGEITLNAITVHDPVVKFVRYQDGSFNFIRPHPHVALKLAHLKVINGSINFDDMPNAAQYSATACNFELLGSTPVDRNAVSNIAALDISGNLDCQQITKEKLTFANVKLALVGNNQQFHFTPLTAQLFGAQGTGELLVNFTADQPQYQLDYQLPQFLVGDFFAALGKKNQIAGTMDFSAHLTAHGNTWSELEQSLAGELSLQGKDLVIRGTDLDEQLAKYETTQNFNLIDAGAFLFTGPLGLVASKGFDFANVLVDEAGASSEIPLVISHWNVQNGVATADDVAMTTRKNLIALKGGLDFPKREFKSMSMGLLDKDGCLRVEQSIAGSFQQPEIAKPNILKSLAGPVLALLRKLDPDKNCTQFYSGSLAARQ